MPEPASSLQRVIDERMKKPSASVTDVPVSTSEQPVVLSGNGSRQAVPITRRRRSPAYESGFAEGYAVGYADGRKPDGGVATNTHSKVECNKSDSATRPQRLLGLPCPNCRTYLFNDETTCPRCKLGNALPLTCEERVVSRVAPGTSKARFSTIDGRRKRVQP